MIFMEAGAYSLFALCLIYKEPKTHQQLFSVDASFSQQRRQQLSHKNRRVQGRPVFEERSSNVFAFLCRGMSSTVRRCIEKASGKEYAVKILDISTEKATEEQARELKESSLREIRILRMLAGHKNISKRTFLASFG